MSKLYIGKFGKLAKKTDRRTLKVARYLKLDKLTQPPKAIDWSGKVNQWPMYDNDTIGDCTCAAVGHQIETWTANANQLVTLALNDVIAAYSAITGYNPATGQNDNGAVELDVLNYWRQTGVGGDKIMAYAEVNAQQISEVQFGVYWFGGIYIGLAMPVSAQNQEVWDLPPGGATGQGAPSSWGGHAVNIVAYDANGLTCITWGQAQQMTWPFFTTYCDEAYCVLSNDWLGKTGLSPSGFDLASLQNDLNAVTKP